MRTAISYQLSAIRTAFSFQLSAFSKSSRHFSLVADSWKLTAGFTLIEMLVSVALFSVVMLVCVGALLSLVNANRKAQALQSVMNNLNIALDGMVRGMRMGSEYDGSSGCSGNAGGPKDCTAGATSLSFKPYGSTAQEAPTTYTFDETGAVCGTHQICKSDLGAGAVAITSPEVTIDDMHFFVVGTTRGDTEQPKVVIVVKGTAGAAGTGARTTFHIQATAVQRLLDL